MAYTMPISLWNNFRIWLGGYRKAWRYFRSHDQQWYREALFYLYWSTDVLVNTLTGGDPEESVSSRIFKDRHALLPRLLVGLLDLIDRDHGRKAANWEVGEGSPNNRELPNPQQVVLIGWWVLVASLPFVL